MGGEILKVVPIKDREIEKDFEEVLKERDKRVYMFYMIASRTGFRQSDILPLRVRDVKGKLKLSIIEKKTKKLREVPIPLEVRREISRYIEGKKDREPLFPSPRKNKRCLDYTTVYKILKEAGKEIGLDHVGTHTCRKTYGHKIFKKRGNIGDVQCMLGHANARDTREYIGADDDYKEEITKDVFS